MARYAAAEDLVLLALPVGALEGMDEDAPETALEAACGFIDGYLRSRYSLPLASVGQDLCRCACVVAAWYLLSARGWAPEGPDEVLLRTYEQQVSWLRDIASGRVTLAVPATAPDVEFTPVVAGEDISAW